MPSLFSFILAIQIIKQELTVPPKSDSEASFESSNSFQEDDGYVGVTPGVNDQDRDVDEDDMADDLLGEMNETEDHAGGEGVSSASNPPSPLKLLMM